MVIFGEALSIFRFLGKLLAIQQDVDENFVWWFFWLENIIQLDRMFGQASSVQKMGNGCAGSSRRAIRAATRPRATHRYGAHGRAGLLALAGVWNHVFERCWEPAEWAHLSHSPWICPRRGDGSADNVPWWAPRLLVHARHGALCGDAAVGDLLRHVGCRKLLTNLAETT